MRPALTNEVYPSHEGRWFVRIMRARLAGSRAQNAGVTSHSNGIIKCRTRYRPGARQVLSYELIILSFLRQISRACMVLPWFCQGLLGFRVIYRICQIVALGEPNLMPR